jgi:hypothetical protein
VGFKGGARPRASGQQGGGLDGLAPGHDVFHGDISMRKGGAWQEWRK